MEVRPSLLRFPAVLDICGKKEILYIYNMHVENPSQGWTSTEGTYQAEM